MANTTYIDAQHVRYQIERLKLDFPELSEDAELLADTCEGETDFHEVLTRLIREERDANAFASALKSEEGALSDRRSRFERRREMTRSLIHSLMETAGQQKIRLPIATLTVSDGRLSCVVTDENQLPDQYVETKRIPKKSEITAALKAGQPVPGAALKNGSPHLTIRT